MHDELQRLTDDVTLLTKRLALLTRWDMERDMSPLADAGITADRTTGDVARAALAAARDTADAAEAIRRRLIERAITEGGTSDREIARAAGATASSIARWRTEIQRGEYST